MVFFVVTEWADEPRPSSNILRLIYQGRFLHGNVTLAGNYLQLQQSGIVSLHLSQTVNTFRKRLKTHLFQCLHLIASSDLSSAS